MTVRPRVGRGAARRRRGPSGHAPTGHGHRQELAGIVRYDLQASASTLRNITPAWSSRTGATHVSSLAGGHWTVCQVRVPGSSSRSGRLGRARHRRSARPMLREPVGDRQRGDDGHDHDGRHGDTAAARPWLLPPRTMPSTRTVSPSAVVSGHLPFVEGMTQARTTRKADRHAQHHRHRVHLPRRRHRGSRRGGGLPHTGWTFDIESDPTMYEFKAEELAEVEALLLGRRTYEGFAAAWPEREGEFAEKFNSMPKYVVSSTLTRPGVEQHHGHRPRRRRRPPRRRGWPDPGRRQRLAGPGPAPRRARRPVEPDGLPGHPRQRQAAVPHRRGGQAEAAGSPTQRTYTNGVQLQVFRRA